MEKNKINIRDFIKIKELFIRIVKFDLFKEALIMSKFIDLGMRKNNDLKEEEEYLDILYKLRWVALPRLDDNGVVDLFAKHFNLMFEFENYSLKDKFKSKLINDIILDDRDKYKDKIKKVLLDNQERISRQKIIVNENILSPTTSSWLKDYNIYMGSANFINNEKRIEYLSYSENVKKLNKKEKEKIRILLEFYDILKLSSFSKEGFEESLGIANEEMKGVLDGGIFTKIEKRDEKRLEIMQKIIDGEEIEKKDITKITDKERQEYREEKVDKLEKDFGSDLERKAIEEEILDKKDFSHLDDEKKNLQKMLSQYKENSLERKAVEEEIENLGS
jgi:hypothetical protein